MSIETKKLYDSISQHRILRYFTSHVTLAFFYGIFLFLYEIKFLRDFIPPIHLLLIGWAGLIVLYDLVILEYWKKISYWKILALFIGIVFITSCLTAEVGFFSNIKVFIMVVLPLLAFYPLCFMGSVWDREKMVLKAMMGSAVVVFLFSLFALCLYFARVSTVITFGGIESLIGIFYYIPDDPSSTMLLYGLYKDTNHAAAYSIIFAVYSILLFYFCRKELFAQQWQNRAGCIFAIANFIVQLCYFPLANSRGGWLSLGVAAGIILFLFFYYKKYSLNSTASKFFLSIGVTILCLVVLLGGLVVLRSGLSVVSSAVHDSFVVLKDQNDSIDKENNDKSIDSVLPSSEIEQPHVDEFKKVDYELGSGRIVIWTEAKDLFLKRPVFGTGSGNNQYYSLKYHVGEEKLSHGTAIHNSFFDLLLDYGIVGFGIFISFLFLCIRKVLKDITSRRDTLSLFYFFTAFVVLFIAGIAMFLSCIFVSTTAMYFVFLIFMGYLMSEPAEKI